MGSMALAIDCWRRGAGICLRYVVVDETDHPGRYSKLLTGLDFAAWSSSSSRPLLVSIDTIFNVGQYGVMTQRLPLDRHTAAGPLEGVRVVDLTTSYAGPTASMYLADLGADVVKVERPGAGDEARGWGPPFGDGVSAWFASANRNKRSVVLNLGSAEGRDLLHSMIGQADVFMESMNPIKLERLGLEPAVLMARYPRLVYCAMSGYGLDGPDSRMPGYDLAAQARSGLMSVTGAKGGPPQRVSTALSDIVTGMSAALAISAALLRQRTDGTGDLVDVSLLDTDLALMAPRIAAFLAGEPEPAPSGGTDSVLAIYQPFQTADRPIVVAIGNDGMWQRFCAAVALPQLADDPALRDNAGRRAHRDRITELVASRLMRAHGRPVAEDTCRGAGALVPRADAVRGGGRPAGGRTGERPAHTWLRSPLQRPQPLPSCVHR